MTELASLELQGAIYAVLSGSAALAALSNPPPGIYDNVPAEATFPYVEFGEFQELPDEADCVDGSETFVTLHVWTRDQDVPGQVLAKRVSAIARDAVRSLSGSDTPSHRIHVLNLQSMVFMTDPDGLSVHGVLTFRALTEPL